MISIHLLFLVHIANVVMSEEVINTTMEATSPELKNAFKFEDQPDARQSYGLIRFEGQDNNLQYSDNHGLDNESQRIKFEEENRIENQRPNHQKKKRRRRRPRQKLPNGVTGYPNGAIPGYPARPGPAFPGPLYLGPRPYPQSGYSGPIYKPRPSATSEALTAVTEALGSIALYDDRQCVARLLCEAAGGAGGAGSAVADSAGGVAGSGLLQAITGLQPLLTLLAAYNGISSSPLFVFGRAVFLGMTSRANPGTCRYAYPDCPNDPEQLVHYLNNHNGGFFRFFAAPELNQQQNLEQFYNQLSGQNYGYYQPQQNLQQNGQLQNYENPNIGYGPNFQQPSYLNQNLQQQGFYQNNYIQQGGYDQNQYPQNFQHPQNIGYQRPSLYGNRYGLYGHTYPYQQNFNNRFKSAKIEKRIQNTRNTEVIINDNVDNNSKWKFPGDSSINNKDIFDNVRLGKVLKFPPNNVKAVKAVNGFVFPGIQSNREYNLNNIEAIDNDNDFIFDIPTPVNDFRFENQYNENKSDNDINNNGVRTLYIIRGNGDPNDPEIVHVAPGQSL